MSKISKFLIAIIVVMLIGNYYVIAVSLNSNQLNFKIRFSGEPEVSNKTKVKAAVTDDLSATINVSDLESKGETVTVTYIVQNVSTDLSAKFSVETTNSNKEYFSLSSNVEKTNLKKGEATKVTIKIELLKEPIVEKQKATIGIQLKAEPVEPTGNDNLDSGAGDTPNNNNGNSNNGNNPNYNGSNNNQNNNNIDSSKPSIKDYFEKDDTPKTGNFNFLNIFWR